MRRAIIVIGVVVVLASLALVGRREGAHALQSQIAGIERIRSAVGRVDSPTLSSFSSAPGFHCLDYRRGQRPLALELCYDDSFRLVQASDRRGATPEVYSTRLDRSATVPTLPREASSRALARARTVATHVLSGIIRFAIDRCTVPVERWAAAATPVKSASASNLCADAEIRLQNIEEPVASAAPASGPPLLHAAEKLVEDYSVAVRQAGGSVTPDVRARIRALAGRATTLEARLPAIALVA
jgi:hypothetical protein